MTDAKSPPDDDYQYAIAAVERETGIAKETLRVWERRYGFPDPRRDDTGERRFSRAQVDRLQMLRHLIERGHRPGRIVRLSEELLREMLADVPVPERAAVADNREADAALEIVHAADQAALRAWFSQALARMGASGFVLQHVRPLAGAVARAQAGGELAVHQVRLFDEAMQGALREALLRVSSGSGWPRVLVAGFAEDRASVDVLMHEVVIAASGCACVSLGPSAPVVAIGEAVDACEIDVIVMPVPARHAPARLHASIGRIAAALPASVSLWLGGGDIGMYRRLPPGVRRYGEIEHVVAAVARWRNRHAEGGA